MIDSQPMWVVLPRVLLFQNWDIGNACSWSSLSCHCWCGFITEITNYSVNCSETIRNTGNIHRWACTREHKPVCLLGLMNMFSHTCFKISWKRSPTISKSARLLIKSPTYQTQRWHTHCSKLFRIPRMVFNGKIISSLHASGSNYIVERWQPPQLG